MHYPPAAWESPSHL